MGDAMGPLSYPPWREGETLPPYPPLQILPPPCEREVQGGYSEPINYGIQSEHCTEHTQGTRREDRAAPRRSQGHSSRH